MYFCIFSIIPPVFSVTWSSEIIIICWFAAQQTFLIIINVENSCAAQYFCGNWYILFFKIHRWIETSEKQHLFEIEIYCNIINVFTGTFDQFNASLMNKSVNLLKKKKILLNVSVVSYLEYCAYYKKKAKVKIIIILINCKN